MKKLSLTLMAFSLITSAFGAEYAAKELYAQMQAHDKLNVHHHDVTVHEKDMGNGVRCYYLVKSMRRTASQDSAKSNPAISCLKIK